MEEESIVRCDLRILHVTRAQADVIIIVGVGLGTRGCAIRRVAGSGTGTTVEFGSKIPVHEQAKAGLTRHRRETHPLASKFSDTLLDWEVDSLWKCSVCR